MDLPGLSFSTGLLVQEKIEKELKLPISNPALGRDSFFLVAAFGRCKFQLSVASVGLILQATIGGVATDFRVFQLSDCVFRFTVSSKTVGFYIYNLFSFQCKLYKLFFHMWGNGGPNWHREFQLFLDEEECSWEKSAPRGQQKKSFAEVVKSTPFIGCQCGSCWTAIGVHQDKATQLQSLWD